MRTRTALQFPNHFDKVHEYILKNKLKMSLLESATLVEQTTPLKSSRLPCDAYVLAIAAFGSFYAASASAPSHKIYLFDKTSLGTSHSFEGHIEGTTSLRGVDSVAGTNRRVIVSSGRDGVVRVWDDRTGTTAIESKYAKLCVPNRTVAGAGAGNISEH